MPNDVKEFIKQNAAGHGHNDMKNHDQKGCEPFDYSKLDTTNPAAKDGKPTVDFYRHFRKDWSTELNTAIDKCAPGEFELNMHSMQDWYSHSKFVKGGHQDELYRIREPGDPRYKYVRNNYSISPDVVPVDLGWDQAQQKTIEWVAEWKKCCACINRTWKRKIPKH